MNFTTLSAEDILTIANPMMDNLMDASTETDHQRHTRSIVYPIIKSRPEDQ